MLGVSSVRFLLGDLRGDELLDGDLFRGDLLESLRLSKRFWNSNLILFSMVLYTVILNAEVLVKLGFDAALGMLVWIFLIFLRLLRVHFF